MTVKRFYRGLFYVLGMLSLALGIVLNTKSGLGVAPILSFPYCISELTGLNFGNLSLAWYILFVFLQLIVRGKDRKWTDLLQIPLSYAFTRCMNFYSAYINLELTAYWQRVALTFVAIAFTGIGIALSVNMRVLPNPADGAVQAMSDRFKIRLGTMKNAFDIGCGAITVVVSLIATHGLVGIGIGTILAMLFNGRAVAISNKLFMKRVMSLAYSPEEAEQYSATL